MSQLIDPITSQFDRLPPNDADAERAALCCMALAVNDAEYFLTATTLSKEMFFCTDHQIIFDVIQSFRVKGKPCDPVTLRSELMRLGLFEEVGGMGMLELILGACPSTAHGQHYAKIVRDKWTIRTCISIANTMLRESYGTASQDGIEIATHAVNSLSELAVGEAGESIIRLGEAMDDVIQRMGERRSTRIATGWRAFDDMLGGYPIGKFTLLGGRPGMGKSQALKQSLRNIASQGTPVGLVTIEETREKVAENCLSAGSGISNNRIAYGNLSPEEMQCVVDANAKAWDMPFFIADRPVKLAEVEREITMLAVKHKCKVIGVDYIQCIDGGEQNENREITMVSRSIKSAFKRLNVAGVSCVQLNRNNSRGEPRRPTLTDMRGSGGLEQDGDLVLLLHSEDYYRREKGDPMRDHRIEIIVAKNKDGPLADIPLRFVPQTQEILDWDDAVPDMFGDRQ